MSIEPDTGREVSWKPKVKYINKKNKKLSRESSLPGMISYVD
jgi:hypothetical protein